jgi:hypothetical protein
MLFHLRRRTAAAPGRRLPFCKLTNPDESFQKQFAAKGDAVGLLYHPVPENESRA